MYGKCHKCKNRRKNVVLRFLSENRFSTRMSSIDFTSNIEAIEFRKKITVFLNNQRRTIGQIKYLIIAKKFADNYKLQIFIFDEDCVFNKMTKFGLTFIELEQSSLVKIIEDSLTSNALRELYILDAKKLGLTSNFIPTCVRKSQKSQSKPQRKNSLIFIKKIFVILIPLILINNLSRVHELEANITLNTRASFELFLKN